MIEGVNYWGAFDWKPKEALAKNKPGATYHSEHLVFDDGRPLLRHTRDEIRKYIERRYGYIKNRKDLRASPHFWRIPKPVRVTGIVFELTN